MSAVTDPSDGYVLVVANQTLRGAAIEQALLARARAATVRFHLVVPATPIDGQFADLLASEHQVPAGGEGAGFVIARRRLAEAERHFRGLGLDIAGEVGGPDPCRAVLDAFAARPVREVVVSTLARGRSRWLRDGLPRRLRRRLDVPIEVVVTQSPSRLLASR